MAETVAPEVPAEAPVEVPDITDWKTPRGRIAALSRSRVQDDPELVEARRDLKFARSAEYITRVVNEAPRLTSEQRARLAAILRGSA